MKTLLSGVLGLTVGMVVGCLGFVVATVSDGDHYLLDELDNGWEYVNS